MIESRWARAARRGNVGVILGGLALLASCADGHDAAPDAGSASAAASDASLTPGYGVLFGEFAGVRDGQTSAESLDALERSVGRKADVNRIYDQWDTAEPSSRVRDDLARGRVPVLSISPQRASGTLTWSAIASGAHDDDIRAQARGLASTGAPLFLSFNHEPDVPGTAHGTHAEYVAAWRQYVHVFREEGVKNVTFVWVVTPYSFETTTADALYPGDDDVDWVGVDAYNFASCRGRPWRSLETILAPVLAWNASHKKPVMLAEWGSIEEASDPGAKAAWLRGALSTFEAHDEIKAAVYFNKTGSCPWWLDSSASGLDAYREVGASSYAHGRSGAWLRPSSSAGKAPFAVTFDASGSTGVTSPTGHGTDAWALDFGDGSAHVQGSGRPTSGAKHTYHSAGTFTASLSTTDWRGTVNVDRVTITIEK